MKEMADALARFSSYIEDPIYCGKPLSVSEASQNNIIAAKYAGHNFPYPKFQQAVEALTSKGSFTSAEKIIQRLINTHTQKIKDKQKIYIIAYAGDMQSALEHEKKHAMYYFCPEFRSRVEGIWGSVSKTNASWAQQFQQHLGKSYCQDVWLDEFQAIVLNREYECTMKMLQLLQSVVPAPNTLPYSYLEIPVSLDMNNGAQYSNYDEFE